MLGVIMGSVVLLDQYKLSFDMNNNVNLHRASVHQPSLRCGILNLSYWWNS